MVKSTSSGSCFRQTMTQSPAQSHISSHSMSNQDFHKHLKALVRKVCQYPPASLERRQGMNQIVRLIQQSKKLWFENTAYYDDALSKTWLYFSQNLCGCTPQKAYDPKRGSVITWLNMYLKFRLKDYQIRQSQEKKKRIVPKHTQDGKMLDPLDQVAASPDKPTGRSLIEAIRQWAEQDDTGELNRTHVRDKAEVNCQMLILRRLPPETTWQELSTEFDCSISTLSGFYRTKCRPQLQAFCKAEGFV